MSILWSALVVGGLLVLVYVMIAGVPGPRQSDDQRRRPRLFLPVAGAFCAVAGVAGYALDDLARLSGMARIAVVLAAGLAAALLAAWIVLRIFATPSTDPEDDPRFRFQGQVATITEAIRADHPGRVVFRIDEQQYDLRARSVDGAPMATNTEVVIEQIDGDVATVELWASVERRL